MHQTRARRHALWALALPLLAGPISCQSQGGSNDANPTVPQNGADLADRFADDAQAQRDVLAMSFIEAARRLGSLRFEASSSFVFSRSGSDVEQVDSYVVVRDAHDNFRVELTTPQSSIELHRIADEVYVRYDKGHLRHKPMRDVDVESLCDLAFSSLPQSLQIFDGLLVLGTPEPTKLGGRATVRVPLLAAREPAPSLPLPSLARPPHLPATSAGAWRTMSRPLDVRGALWIDKATGVVTRAEIDGRVEIADRQVRPTQLTFRYHALASHIGSVPTLTTPTARPEFRRQRPPPADLLSFFRDKLPAPPPDAP